MAVILKPVLFIEAIAWALERGVVLPDVYYNELQGFARSQAFSIAGISAADQLQLVLDDLAVALREGDSFATWKKRASVAEVVGELPAHRIENIYRTNTQGHYARGRCQQQERVKERRPWLLYDAVNDSRTRPAHAALDGFIARRDDPRWKEIYPPNGYQCRCRTVALTEKESGKYRAAWDRKMSNSKAREAFEDAGADEGWSYHPCEDAGVIMDRVVGEKGASLNPRISAAMLAREMIGGHH